MWNRRRRMDLSGSILIAMPGMGDPRFERSVILICAHGPDGAMGLILNKPSRDLSFAGLLDHLEIATDKAGRDIRVQFGGPVERGRGFVLHSADYRAAAGTMAVTDDLAMTATRDILEELARGGGPREALLAMGYSGWGPGQLEGEIARNDWLTATPPEGLIFGRDDGGKWSAALRAMGIDPLLLSSAAGHA
nr:YqgE/AlgH family protein [Gemmobacter caeruleus]